MLPDNRWMLLSKVIPWDKFASLYLKAMETGTGSPPISPRIVLGALIIKHIESLDDSGTIAIIQENPNITGQGGSASPEYPFGSVCPGIVVQFAPEFSISTIFFPSSFIIWGQTVRFFGFSA